MVDLQHHSDNELIEAYKKSSNKELIGTLFKRYMHLVYGVCLKYLKERELARDLTMQVFEKLLSNLSSQEVNNFKSWLYVLTKNECLMHLRKVKPTESINGHDFMEYGIAQHHEEEQLEADLTKLNVCIEGLKAEQQQCVKLFYLEKKCYDEVSETTGFPLKKVKSYLQNGRRNLKLCIEKLRGKEEQTY